MECIRLLTSEEGIYLLKDLRLIFDGVAGIILSFILKD